MKSKRERKNGKPRNVEEADASEPKVSSEALRGVTAIFFVAVAGFLILAEAGGGGKVGGLLYDWFTWLLGVGYLLLPLSLILLALLIFRSFERQFGLVQLARMFVFLL